MLVQVKGGGARISLNEISRSRKAAGQKAAYTRKVRLIPYEEMTPGQESGL